MVGFRAGFRAGAGVGVWGWVTCCGHEVLTVEREGHLDHERQRRGGVGDRGSLAQDAGVACGGARYLVGAAGRRTRIGEISNDF